MCSFCLLTLMEPILIPNCSILYLHSNDINSLKSLHLKKEVIAINNKTLQIKSMYNKTLQIKSIYNKPYK